MNTNGLVRFIVVGMVLLFVISVGMYFLFKPSTTSPPNEADINAIYHVVGEFGARLRDVPNEDPRPLATRAAEAGIGVRVVNGVKVFHAKDGQDYKMVLLSDNKSYAVMYGGDLRDPDNLLAAQLDPGTTEEIDANLKRFITDRLYQKFMNDTSTVPGKPADTKAPWPDIIEIASVQKLDNTSYTVNGKIILMTSLQTVEGGNAGETPITLTLKKVNGTWLIDDVAQSPTS
jgi:hypothetical protein